MSTVEIIAPVAAQPNRVFLLHQLTFPDVIAAARPVVTLTGHMVAGPDRRGANAPYERELWHTWQKDVQVAARRDGAVPQEVMDYFQATKHLERPPEGGAVTQLVEVICDLDTDPGGTTMIEVPVKKHPNPPRFATSFSGMESFCQCPRKWAAEKYFKSVPFEESEAVKWGNRVHKTAENYLLNALNAGRLPVEAECLPLVQKYCDAFLRSGAIIHVEKEICCTKDLKPCGWKSWNDVWFRFKGDVITVKDRVLKYADWKSGAIKDDRFADPAMPTQIEVAIALSDLEFGDQFDAADGMLIYVKEPDPKKAIKKLEQPITKADIPRIWEKTFAITRRMEQAWESETFQARTNGLCKAYCGDLSCPHNGRKR